MTEHNQSTLDAARPAFAVIDDFVTIKVAGAKADTFLQGQFTCDIRSLKPGQAIPGACCDHKGRMLANGWLGRWQENFMLFLPGNMLNLTIEHLQKFAVFSKVTLMAESGWTALNYAGGSLPALPGELIHSQLPYSNPHGYFLHWLMGPEESIRLMQEKLAKQAVSIESATLQLLQIAAQAVFIQPATRALFTPQMIGLEKLGGVSFNKGCYVGQEIVARTQHLGQLKRHLQTLRVITDKAPQPGDALVDNKQEEMGHIAAAAADPQGGYQVLAVVQDRALSGPLFAGNSPASLLEHF
jgi:tRNA-modifying protein YgfZ